MKYEDELRDLADRAEADDEFTSLVIAQTLRTLLGAMNCPIHMQNSFSEYLADYARSALVEIQMLQSGKWNDD